MTTAVKTLAIRSTSEEVMVSRREDLKRGLGSSGGKFPKLTDDSTMRDFIAVRLSTIFHISHA